MVTSKPSLQSFYLRWAGLVSAVLGLGSFLLILLAYREDNPSPKILLGIFGLVGVIVSYAIGKDIMDRVRNHEDSSSMIPNQQVRSAFIGTRFAFVFVNTVLLIMLVSVFLFSISMVERTAALCPSGLNMKSCIYDYTGLWFCK